MKNAKLVDLLGRLSMRELRRFEKYLLCGFFCKHEGVQGLYTYLLPFAPDFEGEGLEKATCYGQLYPDEPYHEDRMNNLISDLLQELYRFLGYTQYEQDEAQQHLYLLDDLFEKDADKHIGRVARRMQHILQKSPARSYQHYLDSSRLQEQLDRFEVLNTQRQFNPHLQQTSDLLDRYFVLNKLRLAADMASRNAIIKATYECQLLEELLAAYAKKERWQEDTVFQLYHTAWRMLETRTNPAYYHDLRRLVDQHSPLLPKEEARNIYNYLLNFAIQQINSGSTEYYWEVLQLYKSMLEKEIIFVNGYLTQWSYKNIITTGIRMQEFDWTAEFIQTYQDRLLPDERDNAVAYNLAAFYYAKGEYQEALLQLQDVEFTDSSYHLGAKIIQLKCYYALEESEPFYALIEAFRKYLRRNRQIGDYRKRANLNLLKLAQRVYKLQQEWSVLSTAKREKQLEELRTLIRQTEPLANKNWLEEKVGGIC